MSLDQRRYLNNFKAFLKENPIFCKIQDEKFHDPLAKSIRRREEPKTGKQRRAVGEVDEVRANSTVVRANAARASTLQDDLLLDSGSNTHIINDVRIGDFKPRSIPSDVTILTGNVELKAVVKGDLKVVLIGDKGEEVDLMMKDVLYVPGYHTNIVSEPQMRKRGLYIDGKTDIWRDKNDEKITSIVRKEDLPYLNFQHGRRGGEK